MRWQEERIKRELFKEVFKGDKGKDILTFLSKVLAPFMCASIR